MNGTNNLEYILGVLNPLKRVTVPPSWPELLAISQKEGLSCLLYKEMLKRGIDIPPPFGEQFRQEYIHTWGKNVRILEELATLLSTLGVPAILLKGTALVSTVYKDKSLRRMGDVDILVRTVDMPEVDNTLNLLGYKSTPIPYSHQLQKCTKCLMYEKNDSPLYIDVHWHLVNPTVLKYVYEEKVNIDRLWQEAVPVRIGQVNALCLAPHHQLLHLSEHAMKHSYISLLSMWDIKEAIDHWGEKLDWKRLCGEAEEFRLTGSLFYGLWLSKELFGTDVPHWILESLRPPHPGLGERVFRDLLRRDRRMGWLCLLFYVSRVQGWRKKSAFLLQGLLPAVDAPFRSNGLNDGHKRGFYRKILLKRLEWMLWTTRW